MHRRVGRFVAVVLIIAQWQAAACAQQPASDSLIQQIDKSLVAAAKYLADRQSPDGAWRSEVYGPLKDGHSLTSLVLWGLLDVPAESVKPVIDRAANYLASGLTAAGKIPQGISYPVYSSAGAVVAFSRLSDEWPAEHMVPRAWLKLLREHQLTEELGWEQGDVLFGGWSYAAGRPRKPQPGETMSPLNEPNISATVFALDALRAASVPSSDPAYEKALAFVKRCQNFGDNEASADPKFDDGGFCFMLNDPVRNKAGIAGTDRHGGQRFSSYGSATADGLRALLACGLKPDHGRVVAARTWLEKNFTAEKNPGNYAADREHARNGVYFYFCCSVACAFENLQQLDPSTGKRIGWAEPLARELLKRQRNDGSWSNPDVAQREDDPLVATPMAIRALVKCRGALAEKSVDPAK